MRGFEDARKNGRWLAKMCKKQKGLVEMRESLEKIHVIENKEVIEIEDGSGSRKKGSNFGGQSHQVIENTCRKMSEKCLAKMSMKTQLLTRRLPRC